MENNHEVKETLKTTCGLGESTEKKALERGREQERIQAIQKMISRGDSKERILELDYTEEEYSKAKGMLGREIRDMSGLRQVQAVDGGMVYTSKNLDTYRKWIERRIEGMKEPVVYNTSRGAKIAGTVELSLMEIMRV